MTEPRTSEATPTPEELASWREWATALHPPGSIQDFMLRLLDALEAATNRWQGMARQWHEQEIAGLTYGAETAERERDAAREAMREMQNAFASFQEDLRGGDTAGQERARQWFYRAVRAEHERASTAEEEARVHAVIDTSHRRMLARVSQEEPENCTRCSFKRTNPHQHPGDPWPWNAAPATETTP